MLSAAHRANPYRQEGVLVTHTVIPGTLPLPLADGQGSDTCVIIRHSRDIYVRTVEVNLERIGKPPDMPPEATALPNETLASSTLQVSDPVYDISEQPTYSLSGVVVFTSTRKPPISVSFPASPLVTQAPAPVLQGGLAGS